MSGDRHAVSEALKAVTDPEIPVLSLEDLGVIRGVEVFSDKIEITITPTYTGCPAMEVMKQDIINVLSQQFDKDIKVLTQLSPAWTTDWITEEGKQRLFDYGIMPPSKNNVIICPQCQSENTELISQFGSTSCKALYRCTECLEPFDYFKCH